MQVTNQSNSNAAFQAIDNYLCTRVGLGEFGGGGLWDVVSLFWEVGHILFRMGQMTFQTNNIVFHCNALLWVLGGLWRQYTLCQHPIHLALNIEVIWFSTLLIYLAPHTLHTIVRQIHLFCPLNTLFSLIFKYTVYTLNLLAP